MKFSIQIIKTIIFSTLLIACSTPSDENKTVENEDNVVVATDVKVKPAELLISSSSFRGIQVGDEIEKHKDYIEKEILSTGEGDFEIYSIKDLNNNAVGYFLLDPNDESKVGDITVESVDAITEDGIKVGDSLQDLKTAVPSIEVHGSEIEGRTYASFNGISYRLDSSNFSYDLDIETIPSDTKILEIVINRKIETFQ